MRFVFGLPCCGRKMDDVEYCTSEAKPEENYFCLMLIFRWKTGKAFSQRRMTNLSFHWDFLFVDLLTSFEYLVFIPIYHVPCVMGHFRPSTEIKY